MNIDPSDDPEILTTAEPDLFIVDPDTGERTPYEGPSITDPVPAAPAPGR